VPHVSSADQPGRVGVPISCICEYARIYERRKDGDIKGISTSMVSGIANGAGQPKKKERKKTRQKLRRMLRSRR